MQNHRSTTPHQPSERRRALTAHKLELLIGLMVLGGILALLLLRNTEPVVPEPVAQPADPQKPVTRRQTSLQKLAPQMRVYEPVVREISAWEPVEDQPDRSARLPKALKPTPPAQVARHSGNPAAAQQSLNSILHSVDGFESLAPQQGEQINDWIGQLADQGEAAVPAIREFFQRNQDVRFDKIQGGDAVAYDSLRVAMIDALNLVGGDQAVQVAAEILQSTANPEELAILTSMLERWAPGQYLDQAYTAARETLAIAASGEWDGQDLAPVFETLQWFGDASVVGDLKQAVHRSNYYATLALAGMADGVGVPALIDLARDAKVSGKGSGDYALRPLAQVALFHPEARTTLIEEARADHIPPSAWPGVAASLGGAHINYGKRVFRDTRTSVSWSSEQVHDRLVLIDEMLAVTRNPAGRKALLNAQGSLRARLR